MNFYIFIIFILGLVVGSFISAYSFRWPRNIPIVKGRSFCDNCNTKISWYDNIPLLSFILLNGKCRSCKKKISLRYPIIEFFTALIFVIVFYYAITVQGGSLYGVTLPYLLAISSALIIIFVIDLEHKLIPDEAVFFIFTAAFLFLLLSSNKAFYTVLFAAFTASVFFIFLNFVTKGRGMGLGDAKLVLALGLVFADWRLIVVWIFLSFIIGSIIGILLIIFGKAKWGKQIPFGPFIITAFFITLFWGNLLTGVFLPYL